MKTMQRHSRQGMQKDTGKLRLGLRIATDKRPFGENRPLGVFSKSGHLCFLLLIFSKKNGAFSRPIGVLSRPTPGMGLFLLKRASIEEMRLMRHNALLLFTSWPWLAGPRSGPAGPKMYMHVYAYLFCKNKLRRAKHNWCIVMCLDAPWCALDTICSTPFSVPWIKWSWQKLVPIDDPGVLWFWQSFALKTFSSGWGWSSMAWFVVARSNSQRLSSSMLLVAFGQRWKLNQKNSCLQQETNRKNGCVPKQPWSL